MTKEEAIKILSKVTLAYEIGNVTITQKEINEALDMAIKALEQVPCEDAISRTAAIVQLSHNKNGDDDCDVIIQKDIETIKTLPPVTPSYNSIKTELNPSEDYISREALIQSLQLHRNFFAISYGSYQCMAPKDKVRVDEIDNCIARVVNAPSVTPKFTDTEIQKMQELEQAQLEKAYELGKAELQPCEDCISREALLTKIDEERKHLLDLNMDGAEHIIVHHARRIIEDMPTVTPHPKMGKWIQTKDDCDGVNFYDFLFECSKCGKEQSFKSNYCPNCGADMRGEEE